MSVARASDVLDQGTPTLVEAVERGEVAVSAAVEISKLPYDAQAAVVEAGPEAVREIAKEIRAGAPLEGVTQSVREGNVVHRTSYTGNNQWFTPPEYLKVAREVLGFPGLRQRKGANWHLCKMKTQSYNIHINELEPGTYQIGLIPSVGHFGAMGTTHYPSKDSLLSALRRHFTYTDAEIKSFFADGELHIKRMNVPLSDDDAAALGWRPDFK